MKIEEYFEYNTLTEDEKEYLHEFNILAMCLTNARDDYKESFLEDFYNTTYPTKFIELIKEDDTDLLSEKLSHIKNHRDTLRDDSKSYTRNFMSFFTTRLEIIINLLKNEIHYRLDGNTNTTKTLDGLSKLSELSGVIKTIIANDNAIRIDSSEKDNMLKIDLAVNLNLLEDLTSEQKTLLKSNLGNAERIVKQVTKTVGDTNEFVTKWGNLILRVMKTLDN